MKLFKEVYRRKAKRLNGFRDTCGLMGNLNERHVLGFDCRNIYGAAASVYSEVCLSGSDEFLIRTNPPSDCVWVQLEDDAAALVVDGDFNNIILISSPGACENKDSTLAALLICMFWLINTPSLVKRTLVTAKKNRRNSAPSSSWMSGDYETVKLCIDGKVISPNVSGEKTGVMPYHFVRGHIRKYLSGETWVNPHWRGNKNVGIRSKQYECVSS